MNTDNNPSGTGSVSVEQATEQLFKMVNASAETENDIDTGDEIDGNTYGGDEIGEEQPETDSETEELDVQGDGDEADDGDEPASAISDDNTIIDMGGGKTETLGELKRRGMFQADYTKKTTEIKAEWEKFNVQRDQVAFRMKQAQVQEFRQVEAILNHFLVPEPDPSLLNDAPAEYQRLEVLRRQQLGAIQAIRQQYGAHEQQMAEYQAHEHKKQAEAEYEKFYAMHPNLDLRAGGEKEIAEATALYHYGAEIYGADAMVQLANSNMMSTLYKAYLYDLSQKQAAKVAPRVAQKPPMVRPSAGITRPASDGARKALDRVRQTGSMDDAIDAYLKTSR